jgi:hypothetical protein
LRDTVLTFARQRVGAGDACCCYTRSFPDTFWSFKHALKFIRKKASLPPLGLLTVAAMLPEDWAKRLVDVNVRKLREEDLAWADVVFISGMIAQQDSAHELIARCRRRARPSWRAGRCSPWNTNSFPPSTISC